MIEKIVWDQRPQFYGDSWTGTATRVNFLGKQVFNLIENVKWEPGPIQLEICEYCGSSGCSSNGYASIVAIGDSVIFCEPTSRAESYLIPAKCLKSTGGIVIPSEVWDREIAVFSNLPRFSDLPAAADWQIASLILLRSPVGGIQDLDNWNVKVDNDIVYVENMESDIFLERVRSYLQQMKDSTRVIVSEEILRPAAIVSVSAYFDQSQEWNGFFRTGEQMFFKISENEYVEICT